MLQSSIRTRYGTAVYIKSDLNYSEIWHDVEIIVTVLSHPFPNTYVVGICQSKTGRISQLIDALTPFHESVLTEPTIDTTSKIIKHIKFGICTFVSYLITHYFLCVVGGEFPTVNN